MSGDPRTRTGDAGPRRICPVCGGTTFAKTRVPGATNDARTFFEFLSVVLDGEAPDDNAPADDVYTCTQCGRHLERGEGVIW
jgi:DNA-directed RNA polymerase subunit RPC12/RpoP